MKSIYLAGPYSPTEKVKSVTKGKIMRDRFEKLNEIAGNLMKQGHIVFSPISHSHPISLHIGNSLSHEFWLAQDRFYMNACDECWVAKLPGWEKSKGVAYEIWYFRMACKPVRYLEV